MKDPICKFCGKSEWRHVCATNGYATNGSNSASNSAGFLKEKSNVGRTGEAKGHREVPRKSISRSAKAVAKVGAEVAGGVQRCLQHDGKEPVDVSAPASGKGKQAHVEDNGVECGLDSGRRSDVMGNRRLRAAFNDYQREYMKVRRAVRSGRACLLKP